MENTEITGRQLGAAEIQALDEKTKQCENFLLVICIFGLLVPLCVWVGLMKGTTPFLTVIAILTGSCPAIFAGYSARVYLGSQKKNSADMEKKGDVSLYIGGVISLILITVCIVLSGGIRGNLMSYYFVFIPSATAVAFKTRKGLIIVSIISALCLTSLYIFAFNESDLIQTEINKFWSLGFTIYQIILVVILELRTNSLMEDL